MEPPKLPTKHVFKPAVNKRLRECERRERVVEESLQEMKENAAIGRFSYEVFEEYLKAASALQRADYRGPIKQIFDSLLHMWEVQARYGKLNLNAVENYAKASTRSRLPIQSNRLRAIMDAAIKTRVKHLARKVGASMMTDQEYEQFLDAIAKKHLKLHRMTPQLGQLHEDVESLMSSSRFVRVVADRPKDEGLYHSLGKELKKAPAKSVVKVMTDAGFLAAIDEAPELMFSNMRRSAIPDDDLEMLRRAGIDDPEAEVTILVQYGRELVFETRKPSEVVGESVERLERIADEMQKKTGKRKILSGIGNLISGLVTGAGNLLLGAGTITAPNPALGYIVLGCAGVSTAFIFKGLSDLRGE